MQLAVYISGFLLIHHPSSFWSFQCYMFPISVLKMQKDACTHTQTHTHTHSTAQMYVFEELKLQRSCWKLSPDTFHWHISLTHYLQLVARYVCVHVCLRGCVCVWWGIFRVFLTWLIKTETLVSPDKKGVSLIELDYSLQTHTGWMNSFIWVLCPLVVI